MSNDLILPSDNGDLAKALDELAETLYELAKRADVEGIESEYEIERFAAKQVAAAYRFALGKVRNQQRLYNV